jgi:FkbM family methyltransferase
MSVEYNHHGMQSMEFFSQYGEDFLLYKMFSTAPSGFFVDIGAFDGIHLSNSYFFERRGWEGICVEPHPAYFPLLKKNRPGSICIQAAVVGTPNTKTIEFFKEDLGLLSGVSVDETFDIEKRYAARGMEFRGFDRIEVPALTLTNLLEAHLPEDQPIDFLSIDTEGNEEDILKELDLYRFRPSAVVVEANTEARRKSITDLMRQKGFVFARRLRCNLIFVKRRDDAALLRYQRIICRIADALHPLGEAATPQGFRGRMIADRDRWIAPNVLCQHANQPFHTLLDYFPANPQGTEHINLSHVVNLFEATDEGRNIQRAVTESMKVAAADPSVGKGRTKLLHVQSSFDSDLTPPGFVRLRDLDRDVRSIKTFAHPRPLPLMFDVLDRAVEGTDEGEFIVFTNSDICLQPIFYGVIRKLIASGFDAVTVNRRTVGVDMLKAAPALARAETGLNHGGFDCFVFRRSAYAEYVKGNGCLGIAGVARPLLYNMVSTAEAMLMLKNVALTYHFGNDRPWQSHLYIDYARHNRADFLSVLETLARQPNAKQRLRDFCLNHPEPKPAQTFFDKG